MIISLSIEHENKQEKAYYWGHCTVAATLLELVVFRFSLVLSNEVMYVYILSFFSFKS